MSDFLMFVLYVIFLTWITYLCIQSGVDLSNNLEFMLR